MMAKNKNDRSISPVGDGGGLPLSSVVPQGTGESGFGGLRKEADSMIEIIVNPTAGRGRTVAIGQQVAQKLTERGIPFRLHTTDHSGHATELAREAAARGTETVIAMGGDGTVTETAAGLHGTQTALGVIPCGTGNDFIKTAGIPANWEEALDFLLTHPARPVDCGRLNDGFFINECGAGFDVMTLDFAAQVKKRFSGLLPYLYGVLRAMIAFRPIRMHIEIDDQVLEGRYMVCAVGNGRYIGGGIPITPCADLTDGQFEVLVVDGVANWRIPFYLPALMMGTLYKKKRVAHRYQARRVLLRCKDMRLNQDGEILPMTEARFEVDEGALLLHW